MKIEKEEFCSIIGSYNLVGVIAVAVSGGVDSMCLAYLSKANHLNIIAIIVDHKLRHESTEEAELTKKRLADNGIESVILTWNGKKPHSNVHKLARDARYDLIITYCTEHNINYVLMGHNYDDQAETIIMRIMRGTGISGLSGIPEKTSKQGISFIRPMLDFPRARIKATIEDAKWDWIEDPSNKKYERGYIRNILSTCDNRDIIVRRLNLLAYNAKRADDFIETQVTEFMGKHTVFSDGAACIKLLFFKNLHTEVALRVLRRVLCKISPKNKEYPPRLLSVERLYYSIVNCTKYKRFTLQDCIISCSIAKHCITFMPENRMLR